MAIPVYMKCRLLFLIAAAWTLGLSGLAGAEPSGSRPEPLKPIGEAKGIHPGRVVWVHDPQVTRLERAGRRTLV